MTEESTASLQDELEQFREEKEQIRAIIGQIGGVGSIRRDKIINVVFIMIIASLLLLDVFRHLVGFSIPIPAMFSLELGVLLVSLKIIWMIHRQTKIDHFQFWILSSIEFRLNDIAKRMHKIDSRNTSITESASANTDKGISP